MSTKQDLIQAIVEDLRSELPKCGDGDIFQPKCGDGDIFQPKCGDGDIDNGKINYFQTSNI